MTYFYNLDSPTSGTGINKIYRPHSVELVIDGWRVTSDFGEVGFSDSGRGEFAVFEIDPAGSIADPLPDGFSFLDTALSFQEAITDLFDGQEPIDFLIAIDQGLLPPAIDLSPNSNAFKIRFSHAEFDQGAFQGTVASVDITGLPATEFSTTLVDGPWIEYVDYLDSFDVNQDGSIDDLDEGLLIGIGLDQSQHYVIRVEITNSGTTGSLNDTYFWDGLRDTFAFDPLGEDFSDGVIDNLCDDDTCDGIGEGLNCTATLSGPPNKKGSPDLRYVIIEPEIDLDASETCETYLYLSTKAASTKGKGSKNTSIFEPSECSFSETDVNGQVPNPIPVNEGVDMLDSNTGELLQGPVGSIHFVPVCP